MLKGFYYLSKIFSIIGKIIGYLIETLRGLCQFAGALFSLLLFVFLLIYIPIWIIIYLVGLYD